MKAICACMMVWALTWSSPAIASTTYPFRSHQAPLTVINSEALSDRSEREVLCLARNIYHEARGQITANQLAVAWVTRNRADISGRTICEVVFEHSRSNGRRSAQFSWTLYNHPRPMERHSWDLAQHLAYQVYMSASDADLTRGATHFHERNARPDWSRRGVNRQQIGAHVFLRLPSYVQVVQVAQAN